MEDDHEVGCGNGFCRMEFYDQLKVMSLVVVGWQWWWVGSGDDGGSSGDGGGSSDGGGSGRSGGSDGGGQERQQ